MYLYGMATPKRVPQRRNKNAGKSTGTSKSAKYFAKNPKARAKKKAYDRKFSATEDQKNSRVETTRETRKRKTPGKDVSHKKDGTLTREKRSTNRARNGKGGKSTKK